MLNVHHTSTSGVLDLMT